MDPDLRWLLGVSIASALLSVFIFWLYKSGWNHYQFLGDRPTHLWPEEDKEDAFYTGEQAHLEDFRRYLIRTKLAAWILGAASVGGFSWFTWLLMN
jgi:hypothetical protein